MAPAPFLTKSCNGRLASEFARKLTDAQTAGTLTSSVSVVQFGNFTRLENLADQQAATPEYPTWQEPAAPGTPPTQGNSNTTPDWDSLI